jgi:predicted DNA-binding transcriptional regulator AlpA
MAKVDVADLIDPAEVAEIIGLGNVNGVSVYRRRHSDFPRPVIEKGRCVLWLRRDVERWAAARQA